MAVTHRPFGALFPIAREKGFFAKHGLDVDVRNYATGTLAIDDMIAGRVDVSMASDFGYATAATHSDSFRILGQVSSGVDHQIVVLKGGGLSGPADLRGKRVGVRTGAAQFPFMLSRVLSDSGVASESVTLVSVPETETADALLQNRVDAIVTWAPLRSGDQSRLAGQVDLWPLSTAATTWSLIAVSPSTLRDRRPAVTSLLAALLEAQHWAEQNPQAALDIARSWSGQPDAYPEGWPADEIYVDLSHTAIVRMEEEVRWLERTTGTPSKAEIDSLVAPDPLAAIDPSLVTIPGR